MAVIIVRSLVLTTMRRMTAVRDLRMMWSLTMCKVDIITNTIFYITVL